ncbi:ABC transporter A family member 9-like [Brassica napus]|uniref:ABC transporter A family member 9-like n=1 Tax=Brassica napus TaxID=3708 RepID=UPI0020786201|nr:ABC transporter A family member 9-like [Brassica napus]
MTCGYIRFWFVLAIYFDNIIPNTSGVRKTIFYFLKPSYWTGKEGNKVEEGSICSCFGSVPPVEHLTPDDQDVLEEEALVKKQAMDGTVVPNIAVQIHGLAKMYPGTTKLGCCKCTKTSPFHAVKFDILWDALSSEEHLHLFASIKGLPPASIKPIAEKLLSDVKLTGTAKIRAGSYCGGMKRRLSVGIALIGDPKLVFLDEPESKKGRAIILTMHSMEEADILGDRIIGIMAKGRLRCIGTSIRLKSRFGTGFITTVSFLENKNNGAGTSPEPLKRFFKKGFFEELQYRESEFGISDIQLGLATLEEVFLNITRWAELESAILINYVLLCLTDELGR